MRDLGTVAAALLSSPICDLRAYAAVLVTAL